MKIATMSLSKTQKTKLTKKVEKVIVASPKNVYTPKNKILHKINVQFISVN